MVKIIVLALVFALILAGMLFYIYRQQRDIDEFSKNLEQCLDAMAAGKSIEEFGGLCDSLWDKIYGKLRKLQHIWEKQNEVNREEKGQLKELVSDISHQTKTPIANLKIYQEILENGEENPQERTEFLRKMRSQTEKLDFLIQSMIKSGQRKRFLICWTMQ